MRKFFLFIFAALLTSNVFAYSYAHRYVDQVPDVGHYTWYHEYKYGSICFYDKYHLGVPKDRLYVIHIFERIPGKTGIVYTYDMDNPELRYWYHYGEITPQGFRSTELATMRDLNHVDYDSPGENVCKYIGDKMEELRQKGYTHFRIAIEVLSRTTQLSKWYPAETENSNDIDRGLFLNNYLDVDFPAWINISHFFAPEEVRYGDQLLLEGIIKASGSVKYKFQECDKYEKESGHFVWKTVKSGTLSTAEAREGQMVQYKRVFTGDGVKPNHLYRLLVTDILTGKSDSTGEHLVVHKYAWVYNDGEPVYRPAGEKITFQKPADCQEYSWTSACPMSYTEMGNYIEYTMPACNVWFDDKTPKYTVKFLNADYSFLKSVEVACGEDATDLAPTPTMGDYTFIGWNKDLTNVHSSFSAVAKYDIGDNYWLNAYVTDHKNEVFPFPGMEKNDARAMVGDKVTVTADVFASAKAGVYYETAPWNSSEQRFLWDPNSGKKVGDYNDPNQERFFDQEISIAYDANTQFVHPFEYKVGVRFYIMLAGVKVYSDPVEIDVCYPMTITSLTGDSIFAENADGDFIQDLTAMIPARYHDTIRVFGINGAGGGCLSFARVLYPSRSLDKGVDEQGQAYFVCPGETETINVDAVKKLIVFDGVYGNGYPKQLDFTAEGFGKLNGYYGEVVTCGGSIQHMPEDPEEEGAVFLGWQAWSTDYADDDYLHVPAIDDNILGFTAQFEYLPEVPQYQVRFYGKDGAPLLKDTLINEGENAVPPAAPEVDGYHFTGWDKPYTTITANTDITALYGEDEKTWYVHFYDLSDASSGYDVHTTVIVADGEAAVGPEPIAKEGYSFAFWCLEGGSFYNNPNYANPYKPADLSHITQHMSVFSKWDVAQYTVTFNVDGKQILSTHINHGSTATADANSAAKYFDQYKPATESEVYTFTGWTPELAPVTADVDYEAVYTTAPRKYTVYFQNWDHVLIDEQQVEYGKAAQAPADPTREGYTFVGWDREFDNIIANMTVTALFEKNKENVTSGICGMDGEGNLADNLTWSFDPETGTLTIEGSGEMMDYGWYPDEAPWIFYIYKIQKVVLPKGMTTIGDYAFASCGVLTDVNIPNTVITIGESAFESCYSLAAITIPSSVVSLGGGAFWECTNLKSITDLAVTPQVLGEDVFEYVDQPNCKLYVPSGAVEAYKAAEVWKEFDIQVAQGIEDIVVPADKAEKVLIDGILYIALPDGKIFDAHGLQVR